jgi:DNA polymerase elongation subunit (family B)
MQTKFIPLDYDYFDFEGKNYIKIYGRNEEEKSICLIDSFNPYFWAILKDNLPKKKIEEIIEYTKSIQLNIKGRKTKVEKVELKEKNFLGKKVKALKIWGTNYKDLRDIADKIGMEEIEKRRGYDLGLITSYIIEKKLNPLTWYKIRGEILHQSNEFGGIDNILETDFVIKLENKTELEKQPNYEPKVLAYDIETDALKPEEGEILMVSLRGKNFKKVISWKKAKTEKKYIEFVKNEKELIKRFTEIVKEYSPDFLVGYNSDFFDLPFLKQRAKKVRTKFPLGKDGTDPKISKSANSIGKISGISHIDLLKFIKTAYAQYMQSETLSLNEVSKEFLEDTKKNFKIQHSSKIKEENWENYYEYNLHDSTLTLRLFEKFWPDMLEFSKIIKEPIFDISRNGLSKQIESYILHNLEKYNEIPEKRPGMDEIEARKNRGGVEGAFVYEPQPGIYENLVMFDFTSMHTSIIISHNISKETLLSSPPKSPSSISNCYVSPEIEIEGKKKKFYFTKTPGFFPSLLKEIFEKRKYYKNEYKKNPNPITFARSNAFKVLSASAHGYIGFFGARYYSWESSSSILAFVRKYNKEIIKKIEKLKHKIIMGDTDSVAFTRENKTKKEIKELLKKLNDDLPGVMHLELEGFFKRGIWVTTRSGETGAKKKYAMIDEKENIKIRGFETVRRDWCQLARKTQDKVLKLILKEGNETKALEYIKTTIKKLKNREIDREQLLIKSQLKKPIQEYKAISPHVVAAKKMQKKELPVGMGSLIKFYIAENNGKSKLVRDKVKLPEEEGKYDIKYYLEKQILPSVEQIFHVFGIEIKEIIDGKKQDSLSSWM